MLNSSFIGLDLELDPNVMWLKWRNVFTTIAEKHAPLRTRRVRSQHTQWLTSEIKKEMNHRDYLKQKATRTNSRYFYQAYKVARNKSNKIIQKAKSEYFKSMINSNINRNIINIAETLNSYFVNVGPSLYQETYQRVKIVTLILCNILQILHLPLMTLLKMTL